MKIINSIILFGILIILAACSTIKEYGSQINQSRVSKPYSQNSELGNPFWILNNNETSVCSPVEDVTVIYLQSTQSIFAINALTGKIIWNNKAKSDIPYRRCLPMKIYENYLIASGENGSVMALNKDTGVEMWHLSGTPSNAPIEDLLVKDDTLFVAWYDSYLEAFDVFTGIPLWKQEVPKRTSLYLAYYNGIVVLEGNGHLQAYHSKTGLLAWDDSLDFSVASMLYNNSMLYIVATGYQTTGLVAMDISKPGRLFWEVSTKDLRLANIQCASMDQDALYISGNRLVKISTINGDLLWQTNELNFLGCPKQLGKLVIAQRGINNYQVFDSESGKTLDIIVSKASIKTSMRFDRNPIVANGVFIISFGEGQLFGYRVGQLGEELRSILSVE